MSWSAQRCTLRLAIAGLHMRVALLVPVHPGNVHGPVVLSWAPAMVQHPAAAAGFNWAHQPQASCPLPSSSAVPLLHVSAAADAACALYCPCKPLVQVRAVDAVV